MRVSCVWEEREGRPSSVAREVCMDKGMYKARLPDHLDQQEYKPKRKGNYGNCVLNELLVLEDSVSMCL